jgi:signal transduction histidine kinase
VKYTPGESVFIETLVEEEPPYWKVSISDRGKGIEDDRKERAFTRYQNAAKGSGLGLSIVHSLVVERYNGKVGIRNRVPDDYRKGTTVEIWLKSTSPEVPSTDGIIIQETKQSEKYNNKNNNNSSSCF